MVKADARHMNDQTALLTRRTTFHALSDFCHVPLGLHCLHKYTSIGPGPIAGIVICVGVVIIIAALGCCATVHRRSRKDAQEARAAQERRWYEAEMGRERRTARDLAELQALQQATQADTPLEPDLEAGRNDAAEEPPPPYEGPTRPLHTFHP